MDNYKAVIIMTKVRCTDYANISMITDNLKVKVIMRRIINMVCETFGTLMDNSSVLGLTTRIKNKDHGHITMTMGILRTQTITKSRVKYNKKN